MATVGKSLYSGASSAAVRLCRGSRSRRNGAPVSSGSIGAHCAVLERCSSRMKTSAVGSVVSPSRLPTTFSPVGKCNVSGSIPGGRCFASQIARLPGELGVALSLIPHYSAIADSRLVSRLGTSGDASILQGTLTHIDPDL